MATFFSNKEGQKNFYVFRSIAMRFQKPANKDLKVVPKEKPHAKLIKKSFVLIQPAGTDFTACMNIGMKYLKPSVRRWKPTHLHAHHSEE